MVNEKILSNTPRNAQLNRHGSDLEIILLGPGLHAGLAAAMAIFVNVLVLYMFFNAWTADAPPMETLSDSTELGVSIFDTHPDIRSPSSAAFDSYFGLFAMFGIGAVFAYYALGLWINRIHIYVSRKILAVKQRPLPWNGNLKVAISDIKKLYTKEVVEDEEADLASNEVYVVNGNDEQKRIIGFKVNGRGISHEHAHFVVIEVGKYLNL